MEQVRRGSFLVLLVTFVTSLIAIPHHWLPLFTALDSLKTPLSTSRRVVGERLARPASWEEKSTSERGIELKILYAKPHGFYRERSYTTSTDSLWYGMLN